MRGLIEDNQLVTIAPVDVREVIAGDIVLVRWKTNFLLHLVKEARANDLLIGNNLGREPSSYEPPTKVGASRPQVRQADFTSARPLHPSRLHNVVSHPRSAQQTALETLTRLSNHGIFLPKKSL
jgi:hypothetical protein